ncbi:hypothetical protein GB931_03875 [Modestobacter sp. I12A-02628]|uniref:TIGR02569 family protein n=1 Tax=Goekera deserti TaxID=2497753 RepID=A0A7K3WJ86_9ACTN|nr:hypothetical protein [Goekera deserti]MPQ97077.1 hypothetical protein [Goekera deserti]NDI46606.1 hypothetical protein [Goekera deserti]NEL56362.1 hypothetical protein [Goekera deserti]
MGPPPDSVLTAFGLTGPATRLPGGQGTTYAVDGAVLKPAGSAVAAEWTADVTAALEPDGFRVATPLGSPGHRVVEGWTAWSALPGEHRRGSTPWPEALRTAARFTAALARVDRPLPPAPDSVFSVADRMAWGEEDPVQGGPGHAVRQLLQELRTPVRAPAQLVHGDLAHNLLWHDHLPPGVIDLSPYRRPAGYCAAVVVVDAVLWSGARADLVGHVADVPEIAQLVVRALLFRLTIGELMLRDPGRWPRGRESDVRADLDRARPLVDRVARQRPTGS